MRIVGMMFVYNEADIVGQTIEHLASQGIDLVVLDNGSADGTSEIIRDHIGKGVLAVERVETAKFDQTQMIKILHKMAIEHSADWMLLSGADEFLESPYRGLTLSRAIRLEAERGFNMLQFNNFEFWPTERDEGSQESDVRKRLRYYSWHDDDQYRAWKMLLGMSAFNPQGHNSKLPEGIVTKLSPNKFVLRHYKIRSYEHGLRKIFNERLPRYPTEDRARGWNVHYDKYGTDRSYFVIDSSKLTRYDEDGNWNLAVTYHDGFGKPLTPSERIAQLQNHINQLENSLSLRIARKIPLGRQIRGLLYPKGDDKLGES